MTSRNSDAIAVRALSPEDVGSVAGLHHRSLPKDFLPSLGEAFLVAVYKSMLEHPHGRVLVATLGTPGPVVGFATISYDPARFTGWIIRRNSLRLVISILRLIRSPRRLLEGIALAFTPSPAPTGCGEIAFIAVDAKYRRIGAGRRLVDAVNADLVSVGITRGCTKTLEANEHVISMYEKHWNARVVNRFRIRQKRYVYLSWRADRWNGTDRSDSVSEAGG